MSSTPNAFFNLNKNLRTKLIVHCISILVVVMLFGVIIIIADAQRAAGRQVDAGIQTYLGLRDVDLGDPVDRAIFRESLSVFYTGQGPRNDSLMAAIDDFRQHEFADPSKKSGSRLQGLSMDFVESLLGMYGQFVAVYLLVLVVIYILAERIGIYRFVKMKQHRESYLSQCIAGVEQIRKHDGMSNPWSSFRTLGLTVVKALAKGVVLVVLFSPAYVIAYAMKTSLDTSSLVFMVLLGVVSNGVLIHTANKFFTLLVAESHKGYVQTAIVKGLSNSYEWDKPGGIPRRSLLNVSWGVRSHAFQHLFLNARFQFIPTLKEHASFLITGLIIIEMALNIQGHLCYELLQQILYRQYDVVCVIVFSIFLTVKATEIAVDIWQDRERRRYGY